MTSPARSALRLLAIAPVFAAMLGLGGCSLLKRDEDSGSGSGAGSGKGSPAPAATSSTRVYNMSKRSEEDANFTLTRVTVEPTATKLDFTMKAADSEFTIAVSPPGHEHAMFIETPDGKKHPFLSAVGISTNPQRDTLKAGESRSFTLIFAPMDPNVTTFSVFEGEDSKNPFERKKHQLWVFWKVQLQ